MDVLLIKMFATALALSQVIVDPKAVEVAFDVERDQEKVAGLLHSGCVHMLKTFDLENINFDELLSTAMEDPEAVGDNKAFREIDFADLHTAYRQFCKDETVERAAIELADVIKFYNKAASDLPDHNKLEGMSFPARASSWNERASVSPRSSKRTSEEPGCRSPIFPITFKKRLLRLRISGFINIVALTNGA